MDAKFLSARAWCVCVGASVALSGCVFEFSETKPRPHGTVGEEIFRTVCLDLAAQAFPNDLTGQKFEARCAGDEGTPFTERAPEAAIEQRALLRYNALLKRRAILVEALDATFDSSAFATNELRSFLANLLPLYDVEDELLPVVTRATAKLLTDLINEKNPAANDAILAFERMAARDGYRPLRLALGVARPLLEYPELDDVVTTTLAELDPDAGGAKAAWQDLLRAAALDMATADDTPSDPLRPGTLSVARKLLLSSDERFSGGRGPLFVAARDHRGVVRPNLIAGQLPSPFSDSNGDGFADLDERGRLVVSNIAQAPTPFRTLNATLFNLDQGARDGLGRAVNMGTPGDLCAGDTPAPGCGAACDADNPCNPGLACSSEGSCVWDGAPPLFYEYIDADRTLLAGVTRDIGKLLLAPDDAAPLTPATLHDFAYGLSAVLGDFKAQTAKLGAAELAFTGPDTQGGPIFDLVHAFGALLPFENTDRLLQVVQLLLREHESEVAGLIEAGLYIDERADAYPNAKWEVPHELWDDLIAWTQRALKRPGMLEAMLRALATDESAASGPLIGNFMRYKDRVSYPKGKLEELLANNPKLDFAVAATSMGADNPDQALARAIQEHRANVNFPCPPLPTGLNEDPVGDCTPLAPHPAAHHKGIRGCDPNEPDCTKGCPADVPEDGASCASAGGFGLCSYPQGACVCDCQGGLCRGDSTPTWRCGLPPTPGFSEFVDRSQPDLRVGADGQTNQSLFQRTAALVHDLHVPAKLCNKQNAQMKLYDPAGSATESALSPLLPTALPILGARGALDRKAECAVMNEPQIVQFFTRSILGTAVLEIKDPALNTLLNRLETLPNIPVLGWVVSLALNPEALERNEVMQRQMQIRGMFVGGVNGNGQTVASPRPGAVARLVFSPMNPFQAHLLDLPPTRDRTPVVDLHRDTIFSWEIKDPVSGMSYYEALTPLLRAFEDHELRDGNGQLTDGYLFADLISIVHKHWSSRDTDATMRACDDTTSPPTCDEAANLFAFQSNGVSYEELAAEALVDAQLMARLRDVMLALDNIEVADGVDGIDVLVTAAYDLLDPERACGPMGCDAQPLATRSGKTDTTTNTGKPIGKLTSAHLLLDSLNAIDKRFEGEMEQRLSPWRNARSELVDLLLDVERVDQSEWKLKNPRSQPVVQNVVAFLRDRLATYKAEQDACIAAGGSPESCQNLREWATGLTPRLEKSLGQPVAAATLRLLDQLWGADKNPGGELLRLVNWISQERSAPNDASFDSTLLSITDMLQLFEDSPNTAPVMRFLSTAIAPNAVEVADKGGDLTAAHLAEGSVEKTLELLRRVKELDPAPEGQQSTLTKLLRALVQEYGKNGETPLEIIIDAIAEVNRAAPIADDGKSLNGRDLRAVLKETEQFLSNERHGLERLYDIIQNRELK